MLPPKSYTNLYNEFIQTAKLWGKGYDKGIIDAKILAVSDNNAEAAACDRAIRELDEEEKKSTDIEDLIVQRQEAEQEIAAIDKMCIRDRPDDGKRKKAVVKQTHSRAYETAALRNQSRRFFSLPPKPTTT